MTFLSSPAGSPRPERDAPENPAVVVRSLFGGAMALAVAMGIGRFAYTPILPAMQAATHLGTGQAGLLASSNYAGYLVGALAITTLAPRAARGSLLIACLVAVVITTGLMGATTNLVAWGLIRFLSGIASAGVFILATGMVLEALRRHGRLALSGWLYSGVGVGIALSGAIVRIAGDRLGWRGDWIGLALLAAAATGLAMRRLITPAPAPADSTRMGTAHREKEPEGPHMRFVLAALCGAYLLEGTGYIVTGTFLVAIVDRMPGLGAFGPSVWIVVGLAAAPSSIAWARLASRVGYAPALVVAYAVQAAGIALPLRGGAEAALIAAILFGGTFIGISALTLTLADQLAPRNSARIIGLLTAAFGLGQIAGPTLAGLLAGRSNSFAPALAAATAMVILAGMLMAAAWWVAE